MTTLSTIEQIKPIERKLNALRRGRMNWIMIDGFVKLWLALLSFCALDMLVDYTFRMDHGQRIFVLLLGLIGLGLITWRWIIKPAQHALTDESLLRAVEDHYGPKTNESILSALQLARTKVDPELNMSGQMISETIRRGTEAAREVSFAVILNSTRRNRNLTAGALGVLLVCMVLTTAAFHGPTRDFLRLWFNRNIMLSPVDKWSERTELYIEGAILTYNEDEKQWELVMTKGDDLNLVVSSKGETPSAVRIRFKTEESGWSSDRMAEKNGQFTYRLPTVLQETTLELSGGDTSTIRYKSMVNDIELEQNMDQIVVVLQPRPEIVQGSLSIEVIPPEYTHRTLGSSVQLDLSQPVHEVLYGSRMVIRGQSTKPLDHLRIGMTKSKDVKRVDLYGMKDFEVKLDAEELEDGAWAMELIDETGIRSKPPVTFVMRMARDKRPETRNTLHGIGDRILITATLPLTVRLRDDYGISDARLIIKGDARLMKGEGDDAASRNYDLQLIGREEINAANATPVVGDGVNIPDAAVNDPTNITFKRRINLQEDVLLVLEEDSSLNLYVESFDNKTIKTPFDDPITRSLVPEEDLAKMDMQSPEHANQSLPRVISLRVVSLEDFTRYMTLREQALATEFSQLVQTQRQLNDSTNAISKAVAELKFLERVKGEGGVDFWTQIGQMEKTQQDIANSMLDIAQRYSDIILEVNNNAMPGASAYERLQLLVIEPLQELAKEDGLVEKAALNLGATRRVGGDLDRRATIFVDVQERQSAIMKEMLAIQEQMQALGRFQVAVNELRLIAQLVGMSNTRLDQLIDDLAKSELGDLEKEDPDLFIE